MNTSDEHYISMDCGCKFKIGDDGKPLMDPEFATINKECQDTWDLISSGNTAGCFQIESRLGKSTCKKTRPNNIKDLADIVTIIRPSCLEAMLDDGNTIYWHYVERKAGREEVSFFHPSLEPILSDTYGLLLTQEQTIRIGQEIGGMSQAESDYLLRKCVSGDTLLYTNMGPQYIKNLSKDKKRFQILTTDDSGKLKYGYATASQSGKKEVFQLSTRNGRYIKATKDHEIYTQDGFKELKDITDSDYVAIPISGSELLGDILNNEYQFVQVKSVKYSGIEETYDFHMEGDSPFGFANGILIHNCIGKKKVELINLAKETFVNGSERVGKINKKEAEEIFSWIEKGARYGFNKCLSPQTVVQVRAGRYMSENCTHVEKTIEELSIGDFIACPNKDYDDVEYCEVTAILDQGQQLLYSVGFDSGDSIECTMDHKFLARTTDSMTKEILPLHEIIKRNLSIIKDSKYGLSDAILSIAKIGLRSSVDITVDNEHHLFYANGLCTSNSHAVSYAATSYITAYAKTHFKHRFFKSWLNHSQDKTKPLIDHDILIQNAKQNGVEVLPPDIRLKNVKFEVDDEKVVFGISNIKSIGERVAESIIDLVPEGIESMGWAECLLTYMLKCRNSSVKILISTGAFDFIGLSRKKMLFQHEKCLTIKEKELQYIIENVCLAGSSLENAIEVLSNAPSGRGECFANSRRKKSIVSLLSDLKRPPMNLDDQIEEVAAWEKSYLGTAISCSIFDAMSRKRSEITCDQFNKRHSGSCEVVGEIRRIHETKTKAKNEDMAFACISDNTGEIDGVVIFSKIWKRYRGLIEQSEVLRFKGYKNEDSFILTKCEEPNTEN